MEEKQAVNPGAALAADDIAQVAGGDGTCSTTVTISGPGISVESTYQSLGDALTGTYDGVVDATSHVIETVANSF
jgi:hypothetical protein